MKTITIVGAGLMAACGGTVSTSAPRVQHVTASFAVTGMPERCAPSATRGDRSMLTTDVGPGTRYALDARDNDAYIRVYGKGSRHLEAGAEARMSACSMRPATDLAAMCSTVSTEAFGKAIAESLEAIGLMATGPELGVGGSLAADPSTPEGHEAWRMSIGVYDWADADLALATVTRALDAWSIGASFGVSVHGVQCPESNDVFTYDIIDELK